ncbi:MAG: type III-A CRISPR-associated RAMP protein Csm3 [Oscillospiraceae bacterium]|jgi:CRISPR-associated protein Csm3|nr:type III-A CRISPR-associated RAMP protein Csm3 [Oscillospiraceae bacterium]
MSYAKIRIAGTIEIKTGLHIGGSSAFSAIGAVDSPVVRDPSTKEPLIPGSSLKGKLRTLLARADRDSVVLQPHNQDGEQILRLFGSSEGGKGDKALIPSRLQFSDCFLTVESKERVKERAGSWTEVKFENTLNRSTAVANPRQIERVVRGCIFDFAVIYDAIAPAELEADFRTVRQGLTLLENDYLGGHGTRGSGRVAFNGLKATCVWGDLPAAQIDAVNSILAGG